ncbi:MAG: hypothetical protein IKQ39_07255 [Oscillospiraceae bacterium]|nr:hypothetical protein [Oscillospiraceae bacterium]
MPHFWKSCGTVLIWILISELLCLVVAFSFAIMSAKWIRWLSLLCGVTAHCLLMGNCAQKISAQDAAHYRLTGERTGQMKPLLLAVCGLIPGALTWLLLPLNPHSVLTMNLFPLLNAPYIQIYRLIVQGEETYAALSVLRRMLMAAPTLVTGAAIWVGYQLAYIPSLAKMDASSPRS